MAESLPSSTRSSSPQNRSDQENHGGDGRGSRSPRNSPLDPPPPRIFPPVTAHCTIRIGVNVGKSAFVKTLSLARRNFVFRSFVRRRLGEPQASIPLELLLGTALFLGREGFRLGLTKEVAEIPRQVHDDSKSARDNGVNQRKAKRDREQRIINVAWLSLPIGALLSLCALVFHLRSCRNQSGTQHELMDYKVAGVMYCLAALVESLAEPLVISCLKRMDLTSKAKAEGVALVFKGLSCFGTLYLTTSRRRTLLPATLKFLGVDASVDAANNFAVTAFGISQVAYAAVFTCIMYRNAIESVEGIQWPRKITPFVDNPYRSDDAKSSNSLRQNLDVDTLHLVQLFTFQGLFKHALTEADKIVLSALAESYDQGVYALASSYGGLAARLLLQPLEENARLFFSRQGALIARNQEVGDDDKNTDYECKVGSVLQDLENSYCFLIRGVLYIGLIFASVATNYTSLLLRILAGNRWGSNSAASDALSAFCVYTAFLALNGTTEAFVYGVARSSKDVGKLGLVHAMIGGVFAVISPALVRTRGAVGLVSANCICMGLRAAYSLYYAHAYFVKADGENKRCPGSFKMITKIAPHPVVMCMFCASYVITRSSRIGYYEGPIAEGSSWLMAASTHIFIGVCCVAVIMAAVLYSEHDIRMALFGLIGGKTESISTENRKEFHIGKLESKPKRSLSAWYMNQMKNHELLTQTITAGILGIIGDIFAQGLEQYLERGGSTTVSDIFSLFATLDKQRTMAMFGDGLISGPLLHYVYELYDALLPIPEMEESDSPSYKISKKRLIMLTAHVLIDNSIMAALYVFLTMCTTAIMEGHYESIPYELKHDFLSAVKASWRSSVGLAPMQLVSFLYLPKELKVLAVNVQDIVWIAVISYATHLNRH
ncbi:hypothetical protein ACHAW6_016191 [Cyclotella cf. meneghiniana]